MFIMFMFIFTRFKADMFQMKVHVIHFQSMHWTATQPRLPRVPGRKIPMAPELALPVEQSKLIKVFYLINEYSMLYSR